jgi:DNA-directed RNA polymerase specialized sigma24 family protein
MWDDGERAFRSFATARSVGLRRQAYLLTGDRSSAEFLAERALLAAHLQYRQFGSAGVDEFARAELVRSFVADAYTDWRPRSAATLGPDRRPGGAFRGRAAVWEALRSLPPRRRAVIVLRYDEGLSEEQIARRLGRPRNNVVADAEAGMLTLRTALGGSTEPGELLPAALAEAGYHWAEWFGSAGALAGAGNGGGPAGGVAVAGNGFAPAAVRAAPARYRPASPADQRRRRGLGGPARTPWTPLAAALAVLALVVPVVTVSVLRDRADQRGQAATHRSTRNPVADRSGASAAPARTVPRGLLDWPVGGQQATDPAVLSNATAVWQAHVRPADAPATGMRLLYAGSLDGRRVVLIQALSRAGRARVAQLDGRSTAALILVHAEPLSAAAAVITIAPASGPGGPLRVLVAPQARFSGGLLATGNVPKGPLRPVPVDRDGVSDRLPAPPGAPTCSQIAVLQPSPSGDVHAPRVLAGGIVRSDTMGLLGGEVQLGPSRLVGEAAGAPDSAWFEDGMRLASKAGGPVVVAALGPRLPARRLSEEDGRMVESHLYELRRGSSLWIGLVVRFAGRTACVSVIPTGSAGVQRPLTGLVARCPLPTHMMAGVVHVIGGPGTDSVQVQLNATRSPAGQMPYQTTVARPAGTSNGAGWAVLAVDPEMFPCGDGVVHADAGRVSAIGELPVYTP